MSALEGNSPVRAPTEMSASVRGGGDPYMPMLANMMQSMMNA